MMFSLQCSVCLTYELPLLPDIHTSKTKTEGGEGGNKRGVFLLFRLGTKKQSENNNGSYAGLLSSYLYFMKNNKVARARGLSRAPVLTTAALALAA